MLNNYGRYIQGGQVNAGNGIYTSKDFAVLQRIIVLKKLGFSLEEIADISSNENDTEYIKESFELQLKLILSGRQDSFEKFLQVKIRRKGLHITKEAGMFRSLK